MRKFLCCSLLVLVFGLQAREPQQSSDNNVDSVPVFDEAKPKIPGDTSDASEGSAKDYAGFTVGVGVNVGVQKTDCDANREFRNAPASVNSTCYGGVVTVGYQHNICGNCFVGIEIGADFGSGSKRFHTGGIPKNESWFVKADYLQKTAIIQQMFRGISNALWVDPAYRPPSFTAWNLNNNTVNGNVWRQFLCAMRYFGGNTNADIHNLVSVDGTPGVAVAQFMSHIPNPVDRVYTVDAAPAPVPNVNAVLASFVGAHTIDNIMSIAEGDLLNGFRDLRGFIGDNFPNLAHILGHIGGNDFYDMRNAANFNNTSIAGNAANIQYDLGFSISEIFDVNRPFEELDNLNELGIANDPAKQAALMEEIRRLYNSNGSDIAYNHAVTAADIRKQLKTKTSFGVCPHASLKVGYFIKEMNSCLYAKVGFILLKGQVSIISDYFLGKEEKFNKTVPFFALGISKIIDGNWGISAEISHALKTHKKMSDIKWHGYKIKNNVGISKTDFRVLVTYAF
ncbi:MAG: hypothetical protein LBJ96_05015 [Holosporaceae bacterium]|jgi:hypothetical protein|nr:hypothetical protein [Holosporaceae bacterium]